MLPTFFGPPSLQSITGSGATITPSAVEPVSGDAFIAVPVPATTATPGATGASIPATTTTQPTAHSLLSPFFHPTTTPTTGSTMPQSGPVAYPWILRVPARATDLLALSAACFGGIPSLIFWARGVGRGSAEDPSARGYAVGALVGCKENGQATAVYFSCSLCGNGNPQIYHISVPLLQIFKFTRAQAHSPSVPLSSTPSALAAAEMAATAAVQGAGRNWESAVASGVLHLGLAVGWVCLTALPREEEEDFCR